MSTERVKVKAREKILETAIKLFSEKGFNGTTTKEISELAGVNEALIFRYFSTKRDLYSAIIERKIREEPSLELPLEGSQDKTHDWQIFESLARRMIEKARVDAAFVRLLYFSALEGHELSTMFFETYVKNLRTLLSDYIEKGIKEGSFRKVNTLFAGRAFIGMVSNYIIARELFGDTTNEKFTDEEAVGCFTDVFLYGIKDK
ncbi:MAG: TetR/AcrR family transcriptional regulator [Thermodesulfobacteriota bacterium]